MTVRPTRAPAARTRRRLAVLAAFVGAALVLPAAPVLAATNDPCGPSGNAVACENSKPGTPASEWDIQSIGNARVEGFTTQTSVLPGGTVSFKIKAPSAYTVDVYRLGYYGGDGARRQAPTWTVSNPVSQPACASDPSTQNYDCGTWSVSTTWSVPSTAVSGVYIAKLTMGTDENEIPFVVRSSGTSDVVLKTSDATWQAYNTYGGADFYEAPTNVTGSRARALKISYNRPYITRDRQNGRDYLYSNEYPTLRFLERNGVNVSYTTDVDVSAGTTDLLKSKTFMSVGHDEYWTGPERQRVTAARDAGVNLMFLSGNEVYWHTRLEASIDGSATPNRTIVCYKDSWESGKIDPGEGTPTWRDPAQPAPAGSQPENALTGTMYMSNFTDLPITVSAAQGRTRLWRGTSLATMTPGTTQALAPHTIGYESDEDVDNGSRPAGLMRLSETTGPSSQYVQNAAGTDVAPGTTTHSVTLYRAASGALVFGAGTINWGWGLDQYHDGDNSNAADPRMQQATLNMLADMGVQPTTLMAGLVQPTASADTVAPTVTVATPGAGANLANGSTVTVTGTATDGGGGVVSTVEVSLDGGQSYHRATGTTAWSYSGVIAGNGATSIRVRAADDSANLSAPTTTGVTVACPCSLFGERVPDVTATTDTSAVELGVKVVPSADGFITGVRFYKGAGNTGTHTGTLWTSSGTALASGTFVGESAAGWQTLVFPVPVAVTGGTTYVASYYAPVGRYAASTGFFGTTWTAAPLSAPGKAAGVANGVYASGHAFPTSSYGDTNYWVDVLFTRDDTTPPSVSQTAPLAGATSVAPLVRPSATFAGTVDPATVAMTLVDAQGTAVPGAAAFDAPTRTVRFTPTAALAHGATYRAQVTAKSASGVPMAAPYSWSFTVALTDPLPGICPCQIWPDSATPTVPSATDTGSVELGVKFRADVQGTVSGVRFYKGPLNVGTHTGSLWTATGTLLASVTFTGESSTGWQTASFSTPVDIAADTTYIVSYRAPAGGYAYTSGGLSSAVDSGPLHTLAAGGVYTYGSGAPLTASSTNYWVDLVFTATDAAPAVTATQPSAGATNVPVGDAVTATLSGFVQSGTARVDVTAGGSAVTGAVSYDATSRTVSFTPTTALTAGTTYTVTVSGATALSGSVMTPYTWSFTTAGGSTGPGCPCTLFSSSAVPTTVDAGDASSVELGVGFTPSVDGQVTGVRFYKSTANTGVHTGTLWSATGQVLRTGTFTGESASGWQTLTFSTPVAVTAGASYVVSYLAPNGHYSATSGFFTNGWSNGPLSATTPNGRYAYGSGGVFPTGSYGASNYWVDPVFNTGAPPDTTPPAVTATGPVDGATSVPVAVAPTATFDEAVTPASVALTLSSAAGSVTGSVAYDAATRTATFTPATALARGATYTASVSATDTAGNAMAPARTWSFTTAQPDPVAGQCPCSLWSDATQPTTMSDTDTRSVVLGTAFTVDTAGSVTGVRFYKSADNSGPHPVSLWAPDGSLLATATPTTESAAGWQTASFAAPVAVTPGTTYVVSYVAPNGRFSVVTGGLATPISASPLATPANAGRYLYGTGAPTSTSSASYMVDPVFATGVVTPPADTTPPAVTAVTASVSGTDATVTWTTDESSTSEVLYGTSPTALTSTATGAAGTTHSVALPGLASGTTYYYRVRSADAAGNTTVSPAATASPATFATADTTPPAVTAVSAAVSGTTATITWTTDEPSTSSVAYGTSAGSLSSSATGATGTAHTVTVSGLAQGTTYYFRVTSADAAGNATTSPATTGAPATFATPDTTPPAVTAVAASGSGTSATVTWTTDETSTSVVQYGTTTALGSTASGASGTAHSVALSGLAPSTRYYYRVVSADPSGNTTTSPAATSAPAVYVPTVAPVALSTVAQFATGSGAYVADDAGGEIIAAPAEGYEMAGTTVPTGLTATTLVTGGTTTVAGGAASLDGTQLASTQTGTTQSMVLKATVTRNQTFGLARDAGVNGPRAAFVVSSTGALSVATTTSGGTPSTANVPGTWTGAPHTFEVRRTSGLQVVFVVDGTTVASGFFFTTTALRPMVADTARDSSPLTVQFLRVGPYTSSSTWTSAVVDAGAVVGWDTLTRDVVAPSGTSVTVRVRSGNTATPDATWTAWTTVSATTSSITRSSRYVQAQVVLTSSSDRFQTPQTRGLTFAFHVL